MCVCVCVFRSAPFQTARLVGISERDEQHLMLNAGCPKAFFQAHSEEFLEGTYVCVDSSRIMFRLTDVPGR